MFVFGFLCVIIACRTFYPVCKSNTDASDICPINITYLLTYLCSKLSFECAVLWSKVVSPCVARDHSSWRRSRGTLPTMLWRSGRRRRQRWAEAVSRSAADESAEQMWNWQDETHLRRSSPAHRASHTLSPTTTKTTHISSIMAYFTH